MAKDDLAQIEGRVIDVLAGGMFSVELENGHKITAKLSGRMRKFHIRVILGDYVTVGVSPYDPTHGLIVHRHQNKKKAMEAQNAKNAAANEQQDEEE